ncbi:hypothetical protein [Streptomyces sp. A012304]|uniref:hypothetical protein n=1 Tax=Streptomyces sp. A012304 TaxID=375446 RepID=UPI0035D51052
MMRPPRAEGWAGLPKSHAEMVRVYGVGCFDGLLTVYGVGVGNMYLEISDCTARSTGILAGKRIPALRARLSEFGVGPEELIQWGGTANADWLFWIPAGEPDSWPTIIVEAGQLSFEVLHRPSPGVVLDLLTGSFSTPIFPCDFPSGHPAFGPFTQ